MSEGKKAVESRDDNHGKELRKMMSRRIESLLNDMAAYEGGADVPEFYFVFHCLQACMTALEGDWMGGGVFAYHSNCESPRDHSMVTFHEDVDEKNELCMYGLIKDMSECVRELINRRRVSRQIRGDISDLLGVPKEKEEPTGSDMN